MKPRVVVVGGGYGGIAAAGALDDVADVTLIEPRETFFHNVAALRAAVDSAWADKIFLPYDDLLSRGRVVRDRATLVTPGHVELAAGTRLDADYLVLATGSSSPFPSRIDVTGRDAARARLHDVRDVLDRASHVLLLGAGPIGLEFAGEIAAAWPEKRVTVVERGPALVAGRFPDGFRVELARQLDALGIRVLLGTTLTATPDPDPGTVRPFTVATGTGEIIAADLWFPAYGTGVRSDYLGAELAAARRSNGRLAVTEHLRVPGHDRVFAIGDLADTPELKMARAAGQHGAVVAANIRALIEGGPLTSYEPMPDGIVLPLGPSGGVTYDVGAGLLGAEVTAQIKANFHLEHVLETLRAAATV
ncbi:FAD-dependent oxidoreductase [Actinoplanes oblitus]|uniref:FAD-dependent oxidoreductase n=1 Tax=Actinoplanes oblitus TaxID=3040509 RepID=A0ABY8WLD4_9ACTN|nr:FAD-dependent oxidoreductase [Actinoplanes oblitus]WIM97348.1 FAD-dependent oxidoreductase [Actinoplanes oblitus]